MLNNTHKTQSSIASTVKKLIMIMGVQRSGTTALFETLATAPGLTARHEAADDDIYDDYFLRSEAEIRPILRAANGAVLLKPVRETERRSIQTVFEEYAAYDLHIIWLYRDPVNVLYSYEQKGWLLREKLESLAVEWVFRNQMTLELLTNYQERLIILRYEELLNSPSILASLSQRLGLKVNSTLHADSNAGRANLPPAFQTTIDRITGRTLALLDQARTLRYEEATRWSSLPFFSGVARRIGRFWPSRADGHNMVRTTVLPTASRTYLSYGVEISSEDTDIFTLAFQREPYLSFQRWRERGPVQFLPVQNIWLVLGYDEVGIALRDPQRFTPLRSSSTDDWFTEATSPAWIDPPENITEMLLPFGTQIPVTRMEQRVRQLLLPSVEKTVFDWKEFVCLATPAVLSDLLGIDPDAGDTLYRKVLQGIPFEALGAEVDFSGVLAKMKEDGKWNADALLAFLSFAGLYHHMLCGFLDNALYLLLETPDWMTRIRQKPESIPALTTELMRLAFPQLTVRRRTTTGVQLADHAIPAGQLIYLALAAANRDPGTFADPDTIDPCRQSPRPLTVGADGSFSNGTVERLGQIVCETVLRVALTEFALLEVAQPRTAIRFTGALPFYREPDSLMVRFTHKDL